MSRTSLELAPSDVVGERLETYARRGIFRSFSRGSVKGSRASYRLFWHRDRPYDVILDTRRRTLRVPVVLPAVERDSRMYAELRAFLRSFQTEERPPHRRIDPARARVRARNEKGNVALRLEVLDDDWDYATEKLVHLVNEIFLTFLYDGRWYPYMIDHLNLDPDRE